MPCPTCGPVPHQLQHDLTKARLVCKTCGFQHRWMDEPEWRALVAVILDAMRGIPIVLRERAAAEDAATAKNAA